MSKEHALTVFENFKIRRVYDEKGETWYFSVVDIIAALIQQPDYQAARNYWKVLKNRLKKEGSQTVTNCNRLKLPAKDGKLRLTDVADPETLLRLIQSVPSPKAERYNRNPTGAALGKRVAGQCGQRYFAAPHEQQESDGRSHEH